jgi:hypothetical protein
VNTKKLETFVVQGVRDDWYVRCLSAMKSAGFRKVSGNKTLFQVSGHFRRFPKPNGRLEIALLPVGDSQTQLSITSVCRTDISAAGGNPNVLLLSIFKDALGAVEVTTTPPAGEPAAPVVHSIAEELERLADLRSQGLLSESEFNDAKAQVIGQSK